MNAIGIVLRLAVASEMLVSAVACASAASAASPEVPINCPQSITPASRLERVPQGWVAFSGSSGHTLERIGFYSANPEQRASLAPDRTTTSRKTERDIWTFPAAAGAEYWAACFYLDTDEFIARKLDPSVSRCDVSYELLKSGKRLRIVGAACR